MGTGYGCASGEDLFTGSRLENLCNEALPICNSRAGCLLREDEYIRGQFPGGQQYIFNTPTDSSRIRIRLHLVDQVFAGTELLFRASDVGCNGFDQELKQDVDLFRLAGDSQTITEVLEVEGRGEHLIEVFSDMTSGFLITTTLVD
ncbi:MAG: hypothetical protein AAF550_08150 [Myxococcota bacterium]